MPNGVLLDTCALIWSAQGAPMTAKAVAAIRRAVSEECLFLSPISAWEIGVLVQRRRLTLSDSPAAFLRTAFAQPGVQVAELTPEIAVGSTCLEGELHADPADRFLVMSAIAYSLRLITRDLRILSYAKRRRTVKALAC
jgi:PIN domain nuclease of toxin-antitoxin system